MLVHIELMREVTDEIIAAFEKLMPQLNHHLSAPTHDELQKMAASQATHVFFARLPDEHGQIVGSATLGTYRTPTGLHAWIEDVVVDQSARRKGVGRALTEACLEQARALGLSEVNLTSRSARCAANRLYQAMGFIRRETNLYRYSLQD
jgi:GNAT superfamily N-acetyltransferase